MTDFKTYSSFEDRRWKTRPLLDEIQGSLNVDLAGWSGFLYLVLTNRSSGASRSAGAIGFAVSVPARWKSMVALGKDGRVDMLVSAIQFPVQMDVDGNLAHLAAAFDGLKAGTLAVAPEGSLSGYEPRPDFVRDLDPDATTRAIETVRDRVEKARVHLVIGACIREAGNWFNSSFYMGPHRELLRYDKINLAQSERGTFTPGRLLPVHEILIDDVPVRLGIQMCREIRYPEQWRILATQGAQIIAYVNNAIGSRTGHELWRAHAISRAAETQRFIVGANNAAPDQTCPSLIISPSGRVLSEAVGKSTTRIEAEIDVNEVSDWVIEQSRDDVVSVRLHP